jgi:tetrachloro-p-hydroquinone reductive dehalogenase
MAIKLHNFPMSVWSQVARLGLAEKGVEYQSVMVNITAPHDQCAPEYMRMNPKGVVPTLEHDDKVITDGIHILRYIDEAFDGPGLHPATEGERAMMGEWLEWTTELPIRELTYGNKLLPNTEQLVPSRIAKLEENMAANPDLADAYRAKIADQKGLLELVGDEDKLAENTAKVGPFLDKLDEHLGRFEFMAGSSWSMADAHATPALMRLTVLGFEPPKRPNIGRYFGAVKQRPSFAASFPPPPK